MVVGYAALTHPTASRSALPRRDRLVAAVVVEAALRLAAEPTGLDIFHEQRTRPVFRISQPLMQHLHDRKTRIETDEIGEFQRPHRVMRAELHGGVDRLDVPDALIERVDRLVDHRQQDAADDEGRKILRYRNLLSD